MIRSHHMAFAVLIASVAAFAEPTSQPTVGKPPPEIFAKLREEDRAVAIAFYEKHLDVGGLSIVAGKDVDDAALLRTRELVSHLLAGRPDILGHMQKVGTRLIIIGKDQVYTDMPDYRRTRDPAYMNERVRGTGGLAITSFGEENLLNLAIDRYDDESIAVHEFCHTIDAALREIDPTWRGRLDAVYQNAKAQGRWRDAYALSNAGEYWAEIAQSYFDCNRTNNWNHRNIGTREQLQAYDPEAYALVRDTFRLNASNDWRFTPVRAQPSVIAPPARFKIDPHYTKFSYARELPIVASDKVDDASLLKANEIVRRMFTYRHDVLKVLINDGARLVILGQGESLSDLPELASSASTQPAWDDARLLDYTTDRKVMVVSEKNLTGTASDTLDGTSGVVRVMARAMYTMTAHRPQDPNWNARPERVVQQYEKRVERLDERFGDRVKALFAAASEKGLWRGTPAATDAITYWSTGVEAYFDAVGEEEPPEGSAGPIATREALQAYDPELFALVEEVFAYRGRVAWRYPKPGRPTVDMDPQR